MEEKKRKFKVTNSWGIYDAYKWVRHHHWYNIGRSMDEKEYFSIVRQVNDLLAEEIAKGTTVSFPFGMGRLELRKYERGVSFIDGQLKNTYPIDWKKTTKLWEEDEEAKQMCILLRYEVPYVFHVKYLRDMANYENKQFYQFTLNRFIKRKLRDNINTGKTDTLWID